MYAMASLASSMELIPLWGRPEWKRRPLTCIFHITDEAVAMGGGGEGGRSRKVVVKGRKC